MTIINRVSLRSVEFGITSIDDVVDAPTIGTATAGIESATVTYTAAATGGAATSFTAISTPGSITGSSATSPITVSGLTGGTAYTFKVYGANASGTWSAVQSAASNSVTPTTTAFDSIATITGTGSSGTITFSSIPNTYQHLQIRCRVQNGSTMGMRFNGDTGTNYGYHFLRGNQTAASAGASTVDTSILNPIYGSSVANNAGVAIIDIHDYASTSKNKVNKSFTGYDENGSGYCMLQSGFWLSTSAINSITIFTTSGNFTTSSTFSLYGIAGA